MNDTLVTQDTDVSIESDVITVVTDFDIEVIQTLDAGPPGPMGPPGPHGPQGPEGPMGPAGNTIWYAPRDPTVTDGTPGDSWINTATNTLFGPKGNTNIWPPGVSLIGPQGPQGIQGPIGPQGVQGIPGNTILYGAVDPTNEGVNGNFYINTTTHFMFGPKAGVWPPGVSIIGPQGPKGDKGDQGIQGVPGAIAEAPTDGQIYGRQTSAWTPVVVPGAVRYDIAQALTGPQIIQARQNIYAAPFDALAFNGMQLNGAMEVAQELGGTQSPPILNGSRYLCDLWQAAVSNATMTLYGQQQVGPAPFKNSLMVTASPGAASFAASDYAMIVQYIEGYRWSRLGWGGANAQPVTIAFWVLSNTVTGIATLAIRNSASNRCYVTTFNIAAANVWQYVVLTIPGDVAGTWLTDTGIGAQIMLCFGAGSSWSATPNQWSANGLISVAGAANFFPAANAGIMITGVVILPGLSAPSSAQSGLIMRPFGVELPMMQRMWEKSYAYGVLPGAGGATSGALTTPALGSAVGFWRGYYAPKRAAPTVTIYSPNTGAAGKAVDSGGSSPDVTATNYPAETGFQMYATLVSVNNSMCNFHYVANARY